MARPDELPTRHTPDKGTVQVCPTCQGDGTFVALDGNCPARWAHRYLNAALPAPAVRPPSREAVVEALNEMENAVVEWAQNSEALSARTLNARAALLALYAPAVPVATEPVADTTAMRRFTVYRRGDLSATHNDQQAAPPDAPQYEGVVFSDGRVALRWLTPLRSTSCWDSLDDALGVHGHPEPRYGTEFVWHDAALPAPRPREEGT